MQPVGTQTGHPLDQAVQVDYEAPARKLMRTCIDDASGNHGRLDRDRADWLSLLYYRGGQDNQWVIWDNTSSRYITRGTDPKRGGLPSHVHRAVSNHFARTIDGICSILNQSAPAKVWSPQTPDDPDLAAADVASNVDEVIHDEIAYHDKLRPELHKLITLTDKALLVPWFDDDEKWGMEGIELMNCPACNQLVEPVEAQQEAQKFNEQLPEAAPESMQRDETSCPDCGGDMQMALDPAGRPELTYRPSGKFRADVYPSFEFSLPQHARGTRSDAEGVDWVLIHSGMTDAQVLDRWPGAKGSLSKTSTGGQLEDGHLQHQYARAMRALSSPQTARASAQASYGSGGPDLNLVYRVQHDPTEEFPQGLQAIMVGDYFEAGPLPVQDDRGRHVKSWLVRSYTTTPQSGFGKPPSDDLVPLQNTHNIIETLIGLILMHNAAPRTFIPLSNRLEREPSGVPGEHVWFSTTTPGEKPFTEQGQNPPQGLYQYLALVEEKFQTLSGLNSVLQGQRPKGDPTLGEIEILQDRGMAAFEEPLKGLVAFERDLARLMIWMAKRSMWANRFQSVQGENGDWEIEKFTQADLSGKVDVRIDFASAWPKTASMRLLRIQKALELGVLPPAAMDPELQGKMLTLMSLEDLKPSFDVTRKQIARELDVWKTAENPRAIGMPSQLNELTMHLHYKSLWMRTEEAEEMARDRPEVYNACFMHLTMTAQMVAMQQAPPPEAGDDKGDKNEKDDKGKGDDAEATTGDGGGEDPARGNAVDELTKAGVIRPAGGGGGGQGDNDPGGLVKAGVLQPAGGGGDG